AYLAQREAQHPGVKPGLAKEILWNDPARRNKTPVALAYLHGFSASRKDISPVVETLARSLGANVFFTRLAAHGLTRSTEFATVTPQDWLDDAREALAIGRRIGERTILIGTSTGALLATLVAHEDNRPDIAALVLLSPNFLLRDHRAQFLSGPLGPLLARIFIGNEHAFRSANAKQSGFWTPRFPSQGIVALMNLVNYAPGIPLP